jgi:hypothetical protein
MLGIMFRTYMKRAVTKEVKTEKMPRALKATMLTLTRVQNTKRAVDNKGANQEERE